MRDRLGVRAPVAAIVLGTGLGQFADHLDAARRMRYADVPGFLAPQVSGHRGELLSGTLHGRQVLVLAGRFHMYEGHSARAAAFPVRVAHTLGAPVLFASNAAGGIRRSFRAGDLMIVTDHINLTFRNPLAGAQESGDERFPDMSSPYSPRLIAMLEESSRSAGIPVSAGVYAGLLGPSYETPAEVLMLERLGADAVGMSTVTETIVARAMGMEVAAVSLISNAAAAPGGELLSHADVVAAAAAAASRFSALVSEFVHRL